VTGQGTPRPAFTQRQSKRAKSSTIALSTSSTRNRSVQLLGGTPKRNLRALYDVANGAQQISGEDCVRVSRLANDGIPETYILPVLANSNDRKMPLALLQDFEVADGDSVKFDSLERIPEIVRSRALIGRFTPPEIRTIHDRVEGRLSDLTGGRTDRIAKAKRRFQNNVDRVGRRVRSLVPQL